MTIIDTLRAFSKKKQAFSPLHFSHLPNKMVCYLHYFSKTTKNLHDYGYAICIMTWAILGELLKAPIRGLLTVYVYMGIPLVLHVRIYGGAPFHGGYKCSVSVENPAMLDETAQSLSVSASLLLQIARSMWFVPLSQIVLSKSNFNSFASNEYF